MDEGSARRKAATYTQDNTNTEQTHTIQTSMARVGFEPTIPGSERAKIVKIVHALDRTRGHCGRRVGLCTGEEKPFTWSAESQDRGRENT
jgi:hypothetical protein